MFLYELHCHTAEGSCCASVGGAELAEIYASRNYSGITVTDHFYGGNTAIDQTLNWSEWVDGFLKGYYCAKEAGESLGLQVFLGWEYNFDGTEFLTYGLGDTWLRNHPELREIGLLDYCNLIQKEGGVIVHAHPFRLRNYQKIIRLLPGMIHGVETANKTNEPKENFLADQYAENYNLMKLGGTDFHHCGHLDRLGGVAMPYRVENVKEILEAASNGELKIL